MKAIALACSGLVLFAATASSQWLDYPEDLGHMDVAVTIDDPKTFTRPVTFTQPTTLTPDGDLLEYFCTDNEQDSAHFR
jgi:hypothetical protein